MGVAPLLFLAETLVERRMQNAERQTMVLIGAKSKDEILCEKEFQRLGFHVKIASDDGSRGFKGKVTDLLRHLLLAIDHQPSTIYACGPRQMLEEVAKISKTHKIPAQVSLEEHMACGIGICFGCALKTKSGYKRVCKDGPVFETEDVIWKEEINYA